MSPYQNHLRKVEQERLLHNHWKNVAVPGVPSLKLLHDKNCNYDYFLNCLASLINCDRRS